VEVAAKNEVSPTPESKAKNDADIVPEESVEKKSSVKGSKQKKHKPSKVSKAPEPTAEETTPDSKDDADNEAPPVVMQAVLAGSVDESSEAESKPLIDSSISSENQADDSAKEDSVKDDSGKKKKAKETPEQKAARIERQKQAKAKVVEKKEDDLSAVAPSVTVDHFQEFPVAEDGWAVVPPKMKPGKKIAEVSPESGAAATPQIPVTTKQISIDAKKVGAVVGPKGATLHSLQDATGTEIITPKDRDAAVAIIVIKGPAEGVQKAKRAIEELATKGYCSLLEGEDFQEGFVSVNPMYIPDIIGKQGATRKAIADHTGVRITVPPKESRDQADDTRIELSGQIAQVAEAKRLIKELTRVYHTPVTHPGFTHAEMDIAPNLFNIIIGAKGSEIKKIQESFKVSVYIPTAESVTKNVLIVGLEGSVAVAERYIQKIIDQAANQAGRDRDATVAANEAWNDGEQQSTHFATSPSSSQLATARTVAPHSASDWSAAILSTSDGW